MLLKSDRAEGTFKTTFSNSKEITLMMLNSINQLFPFTPFFTQSSFLTQNHKFSVHVICKLQAGTLFMALKYMQGPGGLCLHTKRTCKLHGQVI